jgi:glycosyltransferase involved in cell wall biosynthesis
MSPPRIAMLTTFYPPYNFGGDGVGIQRLARAFVRRGWEVTVVYEEDAYLMQAGKEPAPAPPEPGITPIGLRSKLGMVSNLLTHQLGRPVVHHARLKEILRPGAFDVIWFNNISLVGGPGILAYGDGLKVYEAHEHWLVCPTHVLWKHNREVCEARECLSCTLSYKRPPQPWRYTGLLGREIRHVDAFVAKSTFSRDKHRAFGFPREMEVIPYFLPDEGPPAEVAADGSPHERPYFLFVGRLEKIKGVQDILPAFARRPDADLLVIGSGEYEAELKALAKDMPRVRFLGRMAPEDLNRYYRHAEALIVPSVCYETFGIILIESFRIGTPVIARRIGPFPEIVARGGGVLFGDEAELVQAMDRLQSDRKHRQALAQSARRAFERHWSEAAVMAQYERLLHGLALAGGRTHLLQALGTLENA